MLAHRSILLAVLLATHTGRISAQEAHLAGHEGHTSGSDGKALGLASQGSFELERKRYDRAIDWFNQALHRHVPRSTAARIHGLRGEAYLGKGATGSALADFERAVAFAPKEIGGYIGRAKVHEKTGNFKAAASEYARAVDLAPDSAHALNDLAWFKATTPASALRDGPGAVRASTKACELTRWRDPFLIDTLAAAHAEAGDFKQAVLRQEQAIKMRSTLPDDRKGMEDRLGLYRRGQAYRDK